MENLILLDEEEAGRRLSRLRQASHNVSPATGSALLLSDNAMLYYLTGRVFSGWAYIPVDEEETPLWFVKRPVGLKGDTVEYVRKPEDIPGVLEMLGRPLPQAIGLEMEVAPYAAVMRLSKLFPQAEAFNAWPAVRDARAVKTPQEIAMMEQSGRVHTEVYRHIPALFSPGMTDAELDIAIETEARRHGCLGIFRISGTTMEFFMGNILTGENADAASPYDFALGGAGLNPSLPVGACGEVIRPGQVVSVDVNGDYTGYMTDMTRVFSCGEIPQLAREAHECSIEMHRRFRQMAIPGCPAKELYAMAEGLARQAGLEKYFMGHRQKAAFCGHGVGIEINEAPVIAPRSRDILQEHNAIAFEPKFVIPHVGAVGNENTYIVEADQARCITLAPESITALAI